MHLFQSRVWWYLTAEFSLLPLHVAGLYRMGQRNLTSSYARPILQLRSNRPQSCSPTRSTEFCNSREMFRRHLVKPKPLGQRNLYSLVVFMSLFALLLALLTAGAHYDRSCWQPESTCPMALSLCWHLFYVPKLSGSAKLILSH